MDGGASSVSIDLLACLLNFGIVVLSFLCLILMSCRIPFTYPWTKGNSLNAHEPLSPLPFGWFSDTATVGHSAFRTGRRTSSSEDHRHLARRLLCLRSSPSY